MRKQVPNYKDYGGNYAEFGKVVAEVDSKLGRLLIMTQKLPDGIRQVIVKQKSAVTYSVVGLLAHGPQKPLSEEHYKDLSEGERMGVCAHMVALGMPGTGKTVLFDYLGSLIDGMTYARIQCTIDLEPSGVVGSEIITDGTARYRKGPIFNNIVLADEINRTMPKTQAAFLQAMPEGEVSLDILSGNEIEKRTVLLPRPFYVVATYNPIEQEGTFILPEAQLDRFAMQIITTGISVDDAMEVSRLNAEVYYKMRPEPVLSVADVLEIRQFIHHEVAVSPLVRRYAARLAKSLIMHNDLPPEEEERDTAYLAARVLVRDAVLTIAGERYRIRDIVRDAMYARMVILMERVAKVMAFMRGRRYVLPEDIQKVFPHVARHRIFLRDEVKGLLKLEPITDDQRLIVQTELIEMVLRTILRMVPIPLKEPLRC